MIEPPPKSSLGFLPLRRQLLGAILASVVLPRFALAQKNNSAGQEPTGMKIKLSLNNQSMTAALYDNPSARDFFSMLPLDLTTENYASNEKISYLPRKLTAEGAGQFGNEAPGDICYYAPWGNLAMFYAGYRWSEGLIRLGRIDGGFEPLLSRGKMPLTLSRA
jgi:hypothetical protein